MDVCTFPPKDWTLLDLDKINMYYIKESKCHDAKAFILLVDAKSQALSSAANTNPKCDEDFLLSNWHPDRLTILHS